MSTEERDRATAAYAEAKAKGTDFLLWNTASACKRVGCAGVVTSRASIRRCSVTSS